MTHRFENRLVRESSPYLLQHAHNPVDWYPWGEEAFEKAKRENKPVLLSVGYSTCHWCHVMEKESFEDLEIAEVMNQNYVCIKVDREQRPDLDAVHMAVVQALTGQGGWPMTVWLTPDRKPFWGGTYFPPRDGDRGARTGFLTLLRRLHEIFRNHPQDIENQSSQVLSAIRDQMSLDGGELAPISVANDTYESLHSQYDPIHGGFGFAPKFPRPVTFDFLFRFGLHSGNEEAISMALFTLRKMAQGGMYDQLAGGFHRYSVDAHWLVPHFEKMLYDNAQLTHSYLDAFQASGDPFFAKIAREILDYVLREMTDPSGGFWSATDADSEGEEGTFFVWSREEIAAVVGSKDLDLVCKYYGVTPGGNFEGKNILHVAEAATEADPVIDRARKALYSARQKRIPPLTDDKVLTAWNGLMIGAFARAAFVLDESRYLEAAENCTGFILSKLSREGGKLLRSYRGGKSEGEGFLEDYAFLSQGLLELFQATSNVRWLTSAERLMGILLSDFWDAANGGFFTTSDAHETLWVREKPYYDGAEPAGNSVAARVLFRLEALTGKALYGDFARKTIAAFAKVLAGGPAVAPLLVTALLDHYSAPREVALISPTAEANSQAFLDILRKNLLSPFVLVRTVDGKAGDEISKFIPWLEGKGSMDGKPTAYVCEKGRCDLPETDPQGFFKQLAKTRSLANNIG